jgi:hypothetical protein
MHFLHFLWAFLAVWMYRVFDMSTTRSFEAVWGGQWAHFEKKIFFRQKNSPSFCHKNLKNFVARVVEKSTPERYLWSALMGIPNSHVKQNLVLMIVRTLWNVLLFLNYVFKHVAVDRAILFLMSALFSQLMQPARRWCCAGAAYLPNWQGLVAAAADVLIPLWAGCSLLEPPPSAKCWPW